MKTEIKKSLKTGFVLNEQELRRLAATIKEQLKTAYPQSATHQSFEVKFKNGSIAEPTTIDEIFAQENRGSEAIVQLKMKEMVADHKHCFIEITFSEGSGEDSERTISYHITHDDKDWVFVTNSKIDERISRIKRMPYAHMLTARNALPLLFMVIPFIFIALITYLIPNEQFQVSAIQNLTKQYSSDPHASVIDYISRLEVLKAQSSGFDSARYAPIAMLGVVLLALVLGIFGAKVIKYLFPPYNFLWGDYVEIYQRRKNISYIVFVLIALGIVVAVVANVISGKLLPNL